MKVKISIGDLMVECETEDPEAPVADSPSRTIGPAPPGCMDSLLSMAPSAYHEAAEHKNPRVDYDKRMGIRAAHHLTVGEPNDAIWIVDRVKERIAGKTVVELGAGVGYLAVELARHAGHVFAIEADVRWSWTFASKLYETKPRNLTWIFDRIENVIDVMKLRADVAVVVTGSDDVWLRELAGKLADDVIMPWQQYNGGKALISDGGISL